MDSSAPPSQSDRIEFINAVEARMRQVETFTWNVPALIVAGQSFLLTIGLDSTTSDFGRILAALAGIAILVAGVHLLWKHGFNFDVYEGIIAREREALGLPPVTMKELVKLLDKDPDPAWKRWESGMRKRLVRDLRARHVWTGAFVVLFLIAAGHGTRRRPI